MNELGKCIPDTVKCPDPENEYIERYKPTINNDGSYSCEVICKTAIGDKLIEKDNNTCKITDKCSDGKVKVGSVCMSPGDDCKHMKQGVLPGEEYKIGSDGNCHKIKCATPDPLTVSYTLIEDGVCMAKCKIYDPDDLFLIENVNNKCVKTDRCVANGDGGRQVVKLDGKCLMDSQDCSKLKPELTQEEKDNGIKYQVYNSKCNLWCPLKDNKTRLQYEFTYPVGTTSKHKQQRGGEWMYSSNATGCNLSDKCLDDTEEYDSELGRCTMPVNVVFKSNINKPVNFIFKVPLHNFSKNVSLTANQRKQLDDKFPFERNFTFTFINYKQIAPASNQAIQMKLEQDAKVDAPAIDTIDFKESMSSIAIYGEGEKKWDIGDAQGTRYINTADGHGRLKIRSVTYTFTIDLITVGREITYTKYNNACTSYTPGYNAGNKMFGVNDSMLNEFQFNRGRFDICETNCDSRPDCLGFNVSKAKNSHGHYDCKYFKEISCNASSLNDSTHTMYIKPYESLNKSEYKTYVIKKNGKYFAMGNWVDDWKREDAIYRIRDPGAGSNTKRTIIQESDKLRYVSTDENGNWVSGYESSKGGIWTFNHMGGNTYRVKHKIPIGDRFSAEFTIELIPKTMKDIEDEVKKVPKPIYLKLFRYDRNLSKGFYKIIKPENETWEQEYDSLSKKFPFYVIDSLSGKLYEQYMEETGYNKYDVARNYTGNIIAKDSEGYIYLKTPQSRKLYFYETRTGNLTYNIYSDNVPGKLNGEKFVNITGYADGLKIPNIA